MSDIKDRLQGLSKGRLLLLQKQMMAKRQNTIPRAKPGDPLEPSNSQRGLWFLDQLTPGTAAYNAPVAIRLSGPVVEEALRRSLELFLRRHQVLRTRFTAGDGGPEPVVSDVGDVLVVHDLSGMEEALQQAEYDRILSREAARPFDLSRDILIRVFLIRLRPAEHILLSVTHHIAWDAWSKAVFYRELQTAYQAFCTGGDPELPELPIQYSDFARWQNRLLVSAAFQSEIDFWKGQLSGAPAKLVIETGRPRPAVQRFQGSKYPVVLPPGIIEQSKRVAAECGVTLYAVWLSAFYAFLYCYTGQADLLVATPFSGRTHVETERLVGFFIRTMVLRVQFPENLSFRGLMARASEATMSAASHQEMPFEKLVEIIRPPRDVSRMPIAQVNFRVQQDPSPVPGLLGLEATALPVIDNATAKFDLALELAAIPGAAGYMEYNSEVFEEREIARMSGEFQSLLRSLLDAPEELLCDLPLRNEVRSRTSRPHSIRRRERPSS